MWKGEVTDVTLGTVTKNVQDNSDKLKIDSRVGDLQKVGLLVKESSRILRKVLDS